LHTRFHLQISKGDNRPDCVTGTRQNGHNLIDGHALGTGLQDAPHTDTAHQNGQYAAKSNAFAKQDCENNNTKMGEVNSPAPASAIGIMGIAPKYNSMDVTMKTVRAAIGFHNFARTRMPN
jgi:hypothetical protein